jgi:protein involved in polysaccharide export with SLBB domain
LLIDPIVRVTPAEYHSYLVRVTGAVVTPYEFQATEPITLAIALSKAGGPAPNSNGQVQIIRRDRDTGKETTQLVDIRTLLDEADPKDNVTLKGGEEIHLPARL